MNKKASLNWLIEKPIAHRGLHKHGTHYAENSAPAIEAAIQNGFAIEIDLQQTKDHQAIVFHDYKLDRLTNKQGWVKNYNSKDLQNIEITGSNSTILSLQDLLDTVAGRTSLVIEIKADSSTKHLDEFCAYIGSVLSSYTGPCAVMSFHPLAIRWFAKNKPNICRGMVLEVTKKWWNIFPAWHRERYCAMAHAQFVAHDIQSLPDRFTQNWRKKHGPLLTWTVRTEEDRAIAEHYADQIIFENV